MFSKRQCINILSLSWWRRWFSGWTTTRRGDHSTAHPIMDCGGPGPSAQSPLHVFFEHPCQVLQRRSMPSSAGLSLITSHELAGRTHIWWRANLCIACIVLDVFSRLSSLERNSCGVVYRRQFSLRSLVRIEMIRSRRRAMVLSGAQNWS